MSESFSGGCSCGDFRYQVNGEPALMGNCHCTDCKHASGSEMSVVVGVAADSFEILQGETKKWTCKGDSGEDVTRNFCPNCGSRLYTEANVMPGMIIIQAGTLDDPSWVTPSMELYTDKMSDWYQVPEGVATFPGMPTE